MRLIGTLALATLLTACSAGGDTSDGEATDTERASTTRMPPTARTSSTVAPEPSASADNSAPTMTISIRAGEVSLTATLRASAAAHSLIGQLPVTVTMRDHGGVEKTGRLPSALDVSDEPAGADPDPGQLGYYAPGQDLVLYYGDQAYFDGIVILGDLTGDLKALGEIAGGVTVTVTAQ